LQEGQRDTGVFVEVAAYGSTRDGPKPYAQQMRADSARQTEWASRITHGAPANRGPKVTLARQFAPMQRHR